LKFFARKVRKEARRTQNGSVSSLPLRKILFLATLHDMRCDTRLPRS